MDLELVVAVAEILGALAVLVSLVYLAVQIRQNTNSMKANTEQGIASATSSSIIGIAHTNIPYLIVRASADPESLSDEETAQFAIWLNGSLRQWEHAYFQYKSGNFSEDSWNGLFQQILMHMSSEGVRTYWGIRRTTFRRDFRELVDSMAIESGPESSSEAFNKMRSVNGSNEDK
jgi:hypothetical protein